MTWKSLAVLAFASAMAAGPAFAEGRETGKGKVDVAAETARWVDTELKRSLSAILLGKVVAESAEDDRLERLGARIMADRARLATRLYDLARERAVPMDGELVAAVVSVSKLAPDLAVAPSKGPGAEGGRTFERDPAGTDDTAVADAVVAGVRVEKVATQLDEASRRDVQALKQAKGEPGFDERALDRLVDHGETDVDGLRSAAAAIGEPALVAWARSAVRVARRQLDAARDLRRDRVSPPVHDRESPDSARPPPAERPGNAPGLPGGPTVPDPAADPGSDPATGPGAPPKRAPDHRPQEQPLLPR